MRVIVDFSLVSIGVITNIRLGTRTDRAQTLEDKIHSVESKLKTR